jgi:hypothetical protein
MRESLAMHLEKRESIEREIAERIEIHQQRIARLKSARAVLSAVGAQPQSTPLVMLAHGDSWFDYPLSGNDLSFGDTDIIAQLRGMGRVNPVILNMSHYGDATTDEMSLPKQERMISSLQDPANWMGSGKPDAILFSGGGNDVVGDQFCIYLDYAFPGATGLNTGRFDKALSAVEASYLDLFAFRDRYAPGVPLIGHCYDFPIPNGAHPVCAGPWLKPSLDYCGWDLTQGTAIARTALSDFKNVLLRLASDAANNFSVVDTQGALAAADWANELHPYPDGFKKFAEKFVAELQVKFPGRI